MNIAVMGVAALLVGSSASAGIVSSTFDSGTEGWLVNNDANLLAWFFTGGNPSGHITANDRGQGSIWEFVAPAKFLGDQSGFFGGALSWDLIQLTSPGDDISDEPDATLVGAGLVLVLDAGASPSTDWTSYSASLDSSSDWRVGSLAGALASNAQIQAVLADLMALRLRGEFRDAGGDDAGLDNVLLVPAPGAIGALALGGLVAIRRRR